MRYREIIAEAVPLSLARPLMRLDASAQYDELFSSLSQYGRGKSNPQRLYLPIPASYMEDDETPNPDWDSFYGLVKEMVGYFDIMLEGACAPLVQLGRSKLGASVRSAVDGLRSIDKFQYRLGTLTYGGRKLRVGGIINNFISYLGRFLQTCADNLGSRLSSTFRDNKIFIEMIEDIQTQARQAMKLFQSDPTRSLKPSDTEYFLVVSRAAYDIAGMSTGRGWTSCTNLKNGSERKYVPTYIKNGNLIAYLIRSGDWNLKRPTSRKILQRLNNADGHRAFLPSTTYGSDSAGFDRAVKEFVDRLNAGSSGVFSTLPDEQYPVKGLDIARAKDHVRFS